jgi:flagellar hook assembly protein FlgD
MQLLATELQSQDPTQTMDPTTMVTQMVQINQLSDVAGIYSILQGSGSSATSGATSALASNPTHLEHSSVGGN